MNSLLIKSFLLAEANSTTTYLLKAMIVFLVILVVGISISISNKINSLKKAKQNKVLQYKDNKPQGFY